ncbi:MAG: Ca2+-binding RTX toxin-like protein [Myxococcota bacterium]
MYGSLEASTQRPPDENPIKEIRMFPFYRLIGATALSTVLFLAAGCGPVTTVNITVTTNQILAVELGVDSVSYWMLDGSGAVTASEIGVTPIDALVITSDDAAGLYVTTANYTTAPDYTVSVSGTAQVAFSYLDYDEPGFEDLRTSSDGVEMASKHDDIAAAATVLLATWATDLDAMRDALATQAHDEILAARSVLEAGAGMAFDSASLDDINDETAALAPWVLGLEDLSVDLEDEVLADEAIANGIALDMSTIIPGAASVEAAVLACLDPELLGDDVEDYVDGLYGELMAGTRDDLVDDGNDDTGTLKNEKYEYYEGLLSEYLDDVELSIEDVQACVEAATGGEPDIIYDDITVDPYEAIQFAVEGVQATYDYDYTNSGGEPWDHSGLDSNAGLSDPGDDFDPAAWMAPATSAMDVLVALLGAEMFEESTGGTGTTPSPMLSSAKTGSSAGACGASGFVFDLNGLGVPIIIGTPFDDNIIGNDIPGGLELLIGGKGDDCINARSGHELIIGGPGDDELHGGDQHELIIGSAGEDLIYAGYGDSYDITIAGVTVELDLGSVVFGGAGDDQISGSDPDYDPSDASDTGYTDLLFGDGLGSTGEDDILNGGAGSDFLFGQRGDDTLINELSGTITIGGADINFGSFHFAGRGDDTVIGSSSFDLIFGSHDNDNLSGGDGVDLIFCGQGDDVAEGGAQPDLIIGGPGDDELHGGDSVDLVVGGAGDDVITGGDGAFDLLIANAGDDTIDGNGGMDLILAGSGQDFANGNDGIDFVVGSQGNDSLTGGAGIDVLLGGSGRDWVEGGDSIDLLVGSDEVDVLRGNAGLDVLLGGDGDDWLDGGDATDLIWGYDGVDTAFGGDGVDVEFGNGGGDCLYGDDGTDLIFGSDGDDELHGGASLDLMIGSDGDDAIYGEGGSDILIGSNDSDYLSGGDGVNIMFGNGSEDTLIGGPALDLIFSGGSDDCVEGGGGFDIAFTGDGADTGIDLDVAFGGDGDDALEAEAFAFGSDGDDTLVTLSLNASYGGLLFGNDGEDWLYVAASTDTTNILLGGSGDDTISEPGATDPSLSGYPRQITLGGNGGDWIQASVGRNFAFGNRGDDLLSGDHDGGSSSTEDRADFLFGNKDNDHLYGEQSDKRDWMFRGSGSGQTRTRNAWPSTSPAWSGAHAAPSLGTCAPAPATLCTQHEPPHDVGAK